MAKIKSQAMASIGKVAGKFEPSYPAVGIAEWCSHFANSLALPQNTEHRITVYRMIQ